MWSFGITLYEVWTQAALPYTKDWTNMNVMMEVRTEQAGRVCSCGELLPHSRHTPLLG